jgi:hypothetical protein
MSILSYKNIDRKILLLDFEFKLWLWHDGPQECVILEFIFYFIFLLDYVYVD